MLIKFPKFLKYFCLCCTKSQLLYSFAITSHLLLEIYSNSAAKMSSLLALLLEPLDGGVFRVSGGSR